VVQSRWTRIGAWVVMAWLLAIVVNLLTAGMFYDLAVRDVEVAIGTLALAQLTAVREGRTEGAEAQKPVAASQYAVRP
jgi:hypothetical protein